MYKWVEEIWYSKHPLGVVLIPLGWVYGGVARVRRLLYVSGYLKAKRLPVPVIVVGNLTVGGTGKTPVVIWLVNYLRTLGYCPGIIARGYKGCAKQWPQQVRPDSDPVAVGDEAIVLARRCGCPVAVGPDRFVDAQTLLEQNGCDLIVSDDGLQHFALGRDIEIVVVDGVRRHGNRRCLPAGPLREPVSRLRSVDGVVVNGIASPGEFSMKYRMLSPRSLLDETQEQPIEHFKHREVHALAGLGNPERFFADLRALGLKVIQHPFPDHHSFAREDIEFGDGLPVLMTEKDAVKCRRFATPLHWYVPIEAGLPEVFRHRLLSLLKRKRNGQETT